MGLTLPTTSSAKHRPGDGAGPAGDAPAQPVPLRRRARRWFYHGVARLLMLLHRAALGVAALVGSRWRARAGQRAYRVLLTGRFDSDGWVRSHLRPLADSAACSRLCVVATCPLPPIRNVRVVGPPSWLVRLLGATLARHAVFTLTAVRTRPDVVGGFHLLPNGLVCSVLARLVGARSLYICTGGPAEVLDGGIWGEPGPFARMETPDPAVEHALAAAVGACDLVVARGTRAVSFFRDRGVDTRISIIAGGTDSTEFRPARGRRSIDLVLIGRLAEIKRIDVFLAAVKIAREALPSLTAAVVGDGPLRSDLEAAAGELGVDDCVQFTGLQPHVSEWLARSRLFVLTSRSEGLSLALIEAMMCGLPAVVSDVGDLGDLVEDGANGYLLKTPAPERFAARIVELLTDSDKYAAFSAAARRAALRYDRAAATRKWDAVLTAQAAATD